VRAVRQFNRFYTRQIGVLREGLLDTQFSLTQARVLYELGTRAGVQGSQLVEELGLDPGYLSRLLKSFEKRGLIRRSASKADGRVQNLALTAQGRKRFEELNARSADETAAVLAGLSDDGQAELVGSMSSIERLLGGDEDSARPALRSHEPGDIGWIVSRHGELYAREYGWDVSFEGFVAEIAGKFLMNFDAAKERCWIAERDGQRLGCAVLVKQSERTAKLRLLLVEPAARGLGVGQMLVDACIVFAREAGYRKVTLWTNDILHAARRIYERVGFRLVREEKHRSFGQDLVGQFWELKL
jgi:DNA-binding MarR family transcriptional regulator/N-acetylglutamate synthase-like GNAT family acetyltransferase